jgi:glutathionylspermidine synthase
MLEYNADTPTSLLEAAVVQWYWLQDVQPGADQFNSLHEQLIGVWREFQPYVSPHQIHFTSVDDREDGMTIAYLEDVAQQAGFKTTALPIGEIGWDAKSKRFVGLEEETIETIFKLYPWEWLVREEFAVHLVESADTTQWMEPAWKMVLSNKGILPILWELNQGHPNLLPAYADGPRLLRDWVSKPLLSREGANIRIHTGGDEWETGGAYDSPDRIFQEFALTKQFDGKYAVLGSWIIGQEAGGMGIRESDSPVTSNLSQFVPHLFA